MSVVAKPSPSPPVQLPAASITLDQAPVYPDLCACCGAPAQARLTIEKVFERNSTDDTPRSYEIGQVHVPFCPSCTALHEREVKRVSLPWRMLMCFRSPMMISACGAVLFAGLMAQGAQQRAAHGDLNTAAWLVGFSSLCVLAAVAAARSAYGETRRFAVPAQTSITRSFDFSDDLSAPFDTTRHAYTALNPTFAEAFQALNRDRVWNPSSPQAIRASRHRGIVMALFIALVVIVVFYEEFAPFLGWK